MMYALVCHYFAIKALTYNDYSLVGGRARMHTVRAIILIRSSRASANEEHEHTLFGVTYTKKYGEILIYLRVACIIFSKITPCSQI